MGLIQRIGMILAAGTLAAATACDSLCVDRRPRLWPQPDATAPATALDVGVPDADAARPEQPTNPESQIKDICDHFNNDGDGLVDEDGPCLKFAYVEWKEDGTAPLIVKTGDTRSTRVFSAHKLNGWLAWSPDAQWIAYASADAGVPFRFSQSNVFIMRADGEKVQQLTDKPAEYHSLAFSPDGKKIAFFSTRDQGGEKHSMTRDLYVIDVATKQLTRLTFHKEAELWSCPSFPQQISWSRDGTKLVYSCIVGEQVLGEEGSGVNFGGSGYYRGFIYDFTQRRERMFTRRHVKSPVFSPVDDQIAVSGYRNGKENLILTTPTGEPWNYLTEHEQGIDVDDIAWAPNGKALAYIRSKQTREPFSVLANVYTIEPQPRLGEPVPHQVTFHENVLGSPYVSCDSLGWSPSDDWLLYACSISPNAQMPDLFRRMILMAHEARLTLNYMTELGGVMSPRWAPFIPGTAQEEEKRN